MSLINDLMQRVASLTNRLNEIGANSKRTEEMPLMNPVDRNSLLRVSKGGVSYRIPVQGIVDELSLPNEVIQIGLLEVVPDGSGESLKIPDTPTPIWRINGQEFLKNTETLVPIPYAANDKYRTDLVVADTNSDFYRVEGTEGDFLGLAPNIPANTVEVTRINIFGNEIGDPSLPPVGGFIKKLSKQYRAKNLTDPLYNVFYIDADNTTFWVQAGAGDSINGFTEGVFQVARNILYDGMDVFINAKTEVTLIHQDPIAPIKFYFADGNDLAVAEKSIVHLKWNKSNERMELVGVGGGTGIYAGASPTTRTVGGISSGTNISGKTYDELFEGMLAEYINPSISSFAIVGQSSLVEVGTAISGNKNFSFGFSQSGNVANNTIKIIDVTDGNNVLATGRPKTSPQTVNIGSVAKTTATDNVWRIEAESTRSATIARNMSIEWVYPLFATTSSITVGTKQPLVSMQNANNVVLNLVAESGGNKQFFDIPQEWLDNRPLTKIEIFDFNTNAWNSQNQLSTFTAVANTHVVNGSTIDYKRYTNNGSSRGAIRMRLIF